MTQYLYSIKKYNEHMARGVGRNLPISTKSCTEVANFLRGKKVSKAKMLLSEIAELKTAVPMRKYPGSRPHKKGMAAGRYPVNVAKEVLKLLESIEANAQTKGLNTNHLKIIHISSQEGTKSWHYGRQKRHKMKRTHVELVVEEVAEKGTVKKEQKAPTESKAPAVAKPAPEAPKKEVKKEEPKKEVPKEVPKKPAESESKTNDTKTQEVKK